ncbi:MAG: YbjN domain-containing protein [Rhodospirillaceae bacterium]|nr:YbjN domain-containing protein [Rhodospirillaceae bacterium]
MMRDTQQMFRHPIDLIEHTISHYDWPMDRTSDAEMTVQLPGRWCDYSLFINWSENANTVQFTCAFDMRVQTEKRAQLYELLALANEQLWLGHFTVFGEECLPMFRYSLPLKGADIPSPDQVVDVVETALYETERFYPAFQYVIWGGRSAKEAVASAMIETVGEA